MKIDELALEEASAKLLRLRLTDVGGRKERPAETVKSVLQRGLGGMYDDEAVMYILRHGLQYYQSAQQSVHPTDGILRAQQQLSPTKSGTAHDPNLGKPISG